MANASFTEQRTSSGDAIFAEQTPPDIVNITAALQSISSLTSTLSTTLKLISAATGGVSTLAARLQPSFVRMSTSLLSSASVNARAVAQAKFAAQLVATASVTASIDFVDVTPIVFAANLVSSSSVTARLFNATSSIPKRAVLRAVPVESETAQILRYRGDTDADAFLVFDDATGEAIDISGCTFKMALATVNNPNGVEDYVYTLYGVVEDPVSGIVYFSPTVEQSDQIGFFYYDMELDDNKGLIKTLISSSYVYKPDITH